MTARSHTRSYKNAKKRKLRAKYLMIRKHGAIRRRAAKQLPSAADSLFALSEDERRAARFGGR